MGLGYSSQQSKEEQAKLAGQAKDVSKLINLLRNSTRRLNLFMMAEIAATTDSDAILVQKNNFLRIHLVEFLDQVPAVQLDLYETVREVQVPYFYKSTNLRGFEKDMEEGYVKKLEDARKSLEILKKANGQLEDLCRKLELDLRRTEY